MPPFTYQSYQNPFVGQIAQTMQRAGEIPAQAAVQTAAINANAQQQIAQANANARIASGQAWGNAANNIGQAVGGTIATLTDPRRQAEGLQVQQLQRDEKSRVVLESALKNPAFHNEDGTVNDGAVTNYLRTQDVGAWKQWSTISAANAENAQKLRLQASEIAKNDADTATKAQAFQQAQRDYLGRTAYNALKVLDQAPDDPLHARDTFLATVARSAADPYSPVNPTEAKQVVMQTATATPDQLRGLLMSVVPPELKAKLDKEGADTAKANADAAKATAEADRLKAGLTGTPEEQYLTAVTKGDQAGAARILSSMHAMAMAKKDPAQQALATELAGLRGDEARQRLTDLQRKNEPADIQPDMQTTIAGRTYIDLSGYVGADRTKARTAANAAGVVVVGKDQANALQEIDNARANQRDILSQIGDSLPTDAAGRVVQSPAIKLETLFQTDEKKAAFMTWRTAAIQTLRATAGSKGLRINQAEIQQAIENDIPKLTDTYATAQQKVQNINTMLENAERSILVRDRHTDAPDAAPAVVTPPPGAKVRSYDAKTGTFN